MPPPPQKKSIARKIFSSKKQSSQYNNNYYTTKTKKSIGFPLTSPKIHADFSPKTYGDFLKHTVFLLNLYGVFQARDWSTCPQGSSVA
jgi:hypothetical protein